MPILPFFINPFLCLRCVNGANSVCDVSCVVLGAALIVMQLGRCAQRWRGAMNWSSTRGETRGRKISNSVDRVRDPGVLDTEGLHRYSNCVTIWSSQCGRFDFTDRRTLCAPKTTLLPSTNLCVWMRFHAPVLDPALEQLVERPQSEAGRFSSRPAEPNLVRRGA